VEVTLRNGQKFVREADERYRGGPDYPLSDEELRGKFTDCTEQLLEPETRGKIFEIIATLEHLDEVEKLIALARTPA
jgi:2-methylcitrate dehydratase PrpD